MKRSKLKIVMLVMIMIMVISLYQLYFNQSSDSQVNVDFVESKNLIMDFTIYPSTIPENELLRIDEAKKLYNSAFDHSVFYGVVNPEQLIKFLKHAWQWDKNAMPYYYDVLSCKDFYDKRGKEDGIIMSFAEFMHKYRDQLVDSAGKPLVEPAVFKNSQIQWYLWDKFADLKYPYFAYKKGWGMGFCWYDEQGMARPCPDEQLEKSIEYLNYAIDGGYHCYEDLIARMLFQQGDHYQDEKYKQIIKLTEYRKALKSDDLKQAIDYAQLMAEHSSMIGILRMTEAYFYGLGREQDPVKAYAWSLLSDYAKQKITEIGNNLAWDAEQLPPVWEYNKEIQQRLEQMLTPTGKQAALDYLEILKTKIVTWDYNEWRDQIDDFHPKP
ncbi:sel1 repeat family protein [Gilliamella sp. B2969]|nr:sel1 repeat family protein [Gilliamella sp. B2969]